ncbi:hypothetical protein [Anaeromyxobacter sp. PSR-1]|uniref:hypothetical protein n=1 Tax=unclassified Anaeromyxobacter TaxID=2620896 RepID=UPI0005DAF0F9|nr:hypothetical protein [Anaeromyxobacter sp. PSR-1]GAO01626.1 hypothetical protein PSR1_00482 [Anaeromyxobacter sp. PSR-1]
MSYDYTVFRAPADGPMRAWPATSPPALGSVAEVKQRLDDLLRDVAWTQHESTWFGGWQAAEGGAELQLTPEPDGQVRFVTIRRVDRATVEHLCARLRVVAVDPQAMTLYRVETGDWTDAR